MTAYDEARETVVAAARRVSSAGLVHGTAGNLSVRVEDHVAITATGAVLDTLTAEQVVVVDRDGTLVEGDLEPTSELALHLGVYDDTDAGAVVHCHAPASTALSTVLTELPVIHYQQLLLGGAVRVAPYATFGTPELAAAVRDALEGRTAALMANHGSVATGASLPEALDRALLLEWLCRLYLDASVVGTPATLDDQQQEAVVRAALERRYGSTRPAVPRSEAR